MDGERTGGGGKGGGDNVADDGGRRGARTTPAQTVLTLRTTWRDIHTGAGRALHVPRVVVLGGASVTSFQYVVIADGRTAIAPKSRMSQLTESKKLHRTSRDSTKKLSCANLLLASNDDT